MTLLFELTPAYYTHDHTTHIFKQFDRIKKEKNCLIIWKLTQLELLLDTFFDLTPTCYTHDHTAHFLEKSDRINKEKHCLISPKNR